MNYKIMSGNHYYILFIYLNVKPPIEFFFGI